MLRICIWVLRLYTIFVHILVKRLRVPTQYFADLSRVKACMSGDVSRGAEAVLSRCRMVCLLLGSIKAGWPQGETFRAVCL